jgi:tetratricopeptide (TPR) repeat protein
VIGSTRRSAGWLATALLLLAASIAYANSLANPLVFDDHGTVLDNDTIHTLATAIRGGPIQSATAGRPVVNTSLWFNYQLGGVSPAGYHLFNLGILVAAALLLFLIVRQTLERRAARSSPSTATAPAPAAAARRSPPHRRQAGGPTVSESSTATWVAFACALLWLVHPLQSELVDYVTQRSEAMMGLAYLLTLYAAMRGWTTVAILACAAGMMTKESMVTAPVMVLLYDIAFTSGSLTRALRERWRRYAGLAATWLVLFAMIVSGPRWRSAGFSSGVSPWTYLLNQPPLLLGYLRRALWPTGLILDYGLPQPVSLSDVLPAGLLVLALVAVTVVAWFRRRELGFLGLWFFVTLAPTSTIVPIATEVGAERRMHLPLAALVTLLVLGVHSGLRHLAARRAASASPTAAKWGSDRPSSIALGLLAATACALIALTIGRNQEYSTGSRVWRTVIERRPHGRAHYNLGLALKAEGHRAEALAEYQLALVDAPEAHYALGFELDADGNRRAAIGHFQEYIRLKPLDINVIRAYNLLGRALDTEGRADEAAAAFEAVLRMQPRNPDALGGVADIALRQDRFDVAVARYQEYIRLAPDNPSARFNFGLALARSGQLEPAAAAFAEAVRLSPRDTAFRVNLAEALVSLGRLQEAIPHYNAAVQLQPDDQELYARMSAVIAAAGQKR